MLLGLDMQHRGERLAPRFRAGGHAPLGLGERLARDIERLAGGRMGRLGAHGVGLRRGHCGLRAGHRGGKPFRDRTAGRPAAMSARARRDLGELALQPGAALAHARAWLVSSCVRLGRQVGERRRSARRSSVSLRGERRRLPRRPARRRRRAARALAAASRSSVSRSSGEPRQRRLAHRRRAAARARCPRRAGPAAGRARRCARLARASSRSSASRAHHQPRQHGGGARLGLAQCRQFGRRIGLAGRGFGLRAGALGDLAHACVLGGFGLAVTSAWPARSAGGTASPRPCGCSATACGSAPPAGPGA